MPCAANARAALAAGSIQRTEAADGQGPVVVGLFHTGVFRAAAQVFVFVPAMINSTLPLTETAAPEALILTLDSVTFAPVCRLRW